MIECGWFAEVALEPAFAFGEGVAEHDAHEPPRRRDGPHEARV
jgi:hypothetical protein